MKTQVIVTGSKLKVVYEPTLNALAIVKILYYTVDGRPAKLTVNKVMKLKGTNHA